jgi:crotonobetainyl-CoA:carnitine CoA-transferase CaiB-like acyl-CoA transferase
MKKLMVFCIVVAFATSCKKDYECVCTDTSTTAGVTETTVTTLKAKTKKKDAEEWCKGFEKSTVTVGAVAEPAEVGTCVIK